MDNPWTIWAVRNGIPVPSENDPPDGEIESDSMLLNREDADLFGLCPAWDEFYLVRCDECHKVLKPMALKHHIDLRHSRLSRSPSTTSSEMSIEASNSKSFSIKYHSSSNSSTASSASGRNKLAPSVKVKLTKAATKELSREREFSLGRSQIPQENSTYVCQSSAGKEDSEQSSNSSSSANSPTDNAKTLESPGSTLSSNLSLRTRNPAVLEERALATPVVVLTKTLLVNTNSASCSLHLSDRTSSCDSLKRPCTTASESALASGKKKFLPCKDREYDPNKHCGVIASDTGKPCTRSLTCKTHSLSLRRGVPGRLKGFDDLLAENRAAKEQKPPLSITSVDFAPQLSPRPVHPNQFGFPPSPSAVTILEGLEHNSPINESHTSSPGNHSPRPSLAPSLMQQQQQQQPSPASSRSASPSSQVVLATPDGKLTLPIVRVSGSPPPPPPQLVRHDPGPPLAQQLAQSGVGGLVGVAAAVGGVGSMVGGVLANMAKNGASGVRGGLLSSLRSATLSARPLAVPVENPAHNPIAGIQPKPAAMCTFGMRVLSSSNVVLLDRRWDATRGALAAALSPQILPSGQTSLLTNRQGMASGTSGSPTTGPNHRRRVRVTSNRPSSPKQLARKLLSSVRVGVSGISSLSMVASPGQMPPAQLTAGQ
ncbi:putative GPI-anchored protein PB15E9.01c-like [Tropilaelaps mercedesae]|uniref:Putative GPI-anchored protein PB15E9.01c-like n=1 Tax=Tropilaelaps mercedesae TaxID=418985 RepID=A0A1V9XH27_9ACAR|nr:putative GPI-anchored protein PB15E9.01c-like [Tropilaelaps mercedesae]